MSRKVNLSSFGFSRSSATDYAYANTDYQAQIEREAVSAINRAMQKAALQQGNVPPPGIVYNPYAPQNPYQQGAILGADGMPAQPASSKEAAFDLLVQKLGISPDKVQELLASQQEGLIPVLANPEQQIEVDHDVDPEMEEIINATLALSESKKGSPVKKQSKVNKDSTPVNKPQIKAASASSFDTSIIDRAKQFLNNEVVEPPKPKVTVTEFKLAK